MGLMTTPLFPWDSKLRPAWYDRNPLNYQQAYNLSTGPHIANERLTYTCPKGRVAFVELIDIEMVRLTVAAPVGEVHTYVTLTPTTPSYGTIARAIMLTNGVADRVPKQVYGITLFAGEIISIYTVDNGTGGTVRYSGTMKIVEFDARGSKTEFYREPPPDDVQSEKPKPDPVM